MVDFYPEGSGGGDECDQDNTDDEDCYYTDYDHSGHEGSGDDDSVTDRWAGHSHNSQNNRNGHRGTNPQVTKILNDL